MKTTFAIFAVIFTIFTSVSFSQTSASTDPIYTEKIQPIEKLEVMETRCVNGIYQLTSDYFYSELIVIDPENNQVVRYFKNLLPNTVTNLNGDGYKFINSYLVIARDENGKDLVRKTGIWFPEVNTTNMTENAGNK